MEGARDICCPAVVLAACRGQRGSLTIPLLLSLGDARYFYWSGSVNRNDRQPKTTVDLLNEQKSCKT